MTQMAPYRNQSLRRPPLPFKRQHQRRKVPFSETLMMTRTLMMVSARGSLRQRVSSRRKTLRPITYPCSHRSLMQQQPKAQSLSRKNRQMLDSWTWTMMKMRMTFPSRNLHLFGIPLQAVPQRTSEKRSLSQSSSLRHPLRPSRPRRNARASPS